MLEATAIEVSRVDAKGELDAAGQWLALAIEFGGNDDAELTFHVALSLVVMLIENLETATRSLPAPRPPEEIDRARIVSSALERAAERFEHYAKIYRPGSPLRVGYEKDAADARDALAARGRPF